MSIFVYTENVNGVYKKAAFEAVSYAKAIADKPKKKPEGEYRWDAFEPAVTYTAQSSYTQRRATSKSKRTETALVEVKFSEMWVKLSEVRWPDIKII